MNIAILIMSTKTEPSVRNVIAMKDTMIKQTNEESFKHHYDFFEYFYDEDIEGKDDCILGCDQDEQYPNYYHIRISGKESVYHTFEKTYAAFDYLLNREHEYKKYDEAISFYERALSIDPFEASYEYSIAFIKRLKKENDPSLFSKIYTNGPASPLGKCARAFTLIDNGEIEEGKNILLEASGMDPKFSEPYFILGIIYELLHEKEKAIDCYRKSYELNPLDFDAKRAIDRLKKI